MILPDLPFDTIVTIDFETYYAKDYTLRKLTTEGYIRDPRFEVIGVGVQVGDGPRWWFEEAEFRAWARAVDWSRVAILCHHTHFDGSTWLVKAFFSERQAKAWTYGVFE